MTKPANDRPNVVPANVANIVAEFERLVATSKPVSRSEQGQLAARGARSLVIRPK